MRRVFSKALSAKAHLNLLTFIREDRYTVFLKDAGVFGAQGILSSGAATDGVVFVHQTVDVLEK